MAKKGFFDSDAFYAALDAQRQSLGFTWKKVAAEAGVSASTLTRMAQGKRPDIDSLAALAAWAKLDTNQFIRLTAESEKEAVSTEPLAMISIYLRSDKNLSPEAARAIDELVKVTYARLRKD